MTLEKLGQLAIEIMSNKSQLNSIQISGKNAYQYLLKLTGKLLEHTTETFLIEGEATSKDYEIYHNPITNETSSKPLPEISKLSPKVQDIILPRLVRHAEKIGEPFVSALQENIELTLENQQPEDKRVLGLHTERLISSHILLDLLPMDSIVGDSPLEKSPQLKNLTGFTATSEGRLSRN